jgi:hypothetical protein
MNHLTPALKAAKKQGNRMKFLISLLLLLLLINFQYQDHCLAPDLFQDLDLILYQYQDPDLVPDHYQAPALGQVPDQSQAQSLCHGIIAEENGSRTLSITGLAAGS